MLFAPVGNRNAPRKKFCALSYKTKISLIGAVCAPLSPDSRTWVKILGRESRVAAGRLTLEPQNVYLKWSSQRAQSFKRDLEWNGSVWTKLWSKYRNVCVLWEGSGWKYLAEFQFNNLNLSTRCNYQEWACLLWCDRTANFIPRCVATKETDKKLGEYT